MSFSGVFSVLPTPFRGGGDVDVDSLRRVVDLIVGAGVNGVTALGVTGEVSRLNERERRLVVEHVVDQVNGRAKVIVGASLTGSTSTVNVRVKTFTPPLFVPPSSMTVTVMTALPLR